MKESWRSDTHEVLVRRRLAEPAAPPPQPLLAAAQRLLEELTRLRRIPVTLVGYDELVDSLDAQTPPLPIAFRQAIWWEAGYQLAAQGLHREADVATDRYQKACDKCPGTSARAGRRGDSRIRYQCWATGLLQRGFSERTRCVSEGMAVRLRAAPHAPAPPDRLFSDLGAFGATARELADEALADQESGRRPGSLQDARPLWRNLPACGRPAARHQISISARTQPRKSYSARRV